MSKTLKNALLVFAGGWCYGVVIPLVKLGQSLGYSSTDIMAIQYLVGVATLGIVYLAMGRPKVTLKQVLQLAGVGVIAAGVSLFYFNALALLSAAAALTLLFQFVWMGVLLQTIRERRLPNRFSAIAVLLILGGTVLAAGLLKPQDVPLNALGVVFGLLSAVFYTAFLHFSGRVATSLPTTTRTLFTNMGSLIVTLCISPASFVNVAFFKDFALFGIPLALLGIVLPVLLIQKGAPHISDGVTTIMASSELPSGILMAALFIGDAVGVLEWLGVVIILGGIVLSQWKNIRSRARPAST
ncbi:MAG: DMT family transporter [Coriobacteriia bacterium]|nr:DMT family transporter [Coriobacteriia bacterium]